jgi:hypothetical protein
LASDGATCGNASHATIRFRRGVLNIRRKSNTLKIIIPPGTVTETRQQTNGVIASELTFKFSTVKVVVTLDPPNTC